MRTTSLFFVAMLLGGEAISAEPALTLGDVSVQGTNSGVDRATVTNAAEGEIRHVDVSRVVGRHLIVSVSLQATEAPFACYVNATVHDSKTGTMIAIVQSKARAEGAADLELRRKVARVAVKGAVGQISDAISGPKH